jgi:hypothetical protein
MSVDGRSVEFYAEDGSSDQRGQLIGPVYFSDNAFLANHERVEVVGNAIHRTDYAYFLIIRGVEFWGFERDPSHDPPVHRHTYGHEERIDAKPVSFKRVCELGWHDVGLQADTADS